MRRVRIVHAEPVILTVTDYGVAAKHVYDIVADKARVRLVHRVILDADIWQVSHTCRDNLTCDHETAARLAAYAHMSRHTLRTTMDDPGERIAKAQLLRYGRCIARLADLGYELVEQEAVKL